MWVIYTNYSFASNQNLKLHQPSFKRQPICVTTQSRWRQLWAFIISHFFHEGLTSDFLLMGKSKQTLAMRSAPYIAHFRFQSTTTKFSPT